MTIKEDVAALTEAVKVLTDKFEAKEQAEQLAKSPGTVAKPALPADAAVDIALDGPSDDVSSIYRAAVDDALNKEFGIHVRNLGGQFKFTVLVPEKYSSLSPEQRRMVGFDMRPKVIDNAEGVNGVTLWCQKVYGNFSPAMQAQITSDRLATM